MCCFFHLRLTGNSLYINNDNIYYQREHYPSWLVRLLAILGPACDGFSQAGKMPLNLFLVSQYIMYNGIEIYYVFIKLYVFLMFEIAIDVIVH